MNRMIMLSWGAIAAVCQLPATGTVLADVDLAKYERDVVRSDQIQVSIANGSEGEFWKHGSLSYSFRLTPGDDCLFLESTSGDNRLVCANSWGGQGCRLIAKLKDPSFAVDGAIQNVGPAVTRPKDAQPCQVEVAMTGEGRPLLLRTGGLTTAVVDAQRDGRSLVLALQGRPSNFARERIVISTAGLPVEAVSGAEVVLYSRINRELRGRKVVDELHA